MREYHVLLTLTVAAILTGVGLAEDYKTSCLPRDCGLFRASSRHCVGIESLNGPTGPTFSSTSDEFTSTRERSLS